ncbi:MAG: hypothetical protein HUJ16_04550 [Kangiella sp.]|nr:hypothetical protein [Kangiella sp.]
MKKQTLFNGLLLVFLVFISYKLITIESQLAKQQLQNKPVDAVSSQQPTANDTRTFHSNPNHPLDADLDADIIRSIVAEELDIALANNQISPEKTPNNFEDNSTSVDDHLIAEINNQMIGYMSDGIISESELKNIERSMATMSHAERQKVIQILAKNATNYSAIITH